MTLDDLRTKTFEVNYIGEDVFDWRDLFDGKIRIPGDEHFHHEYTMNSRASHSGGEGVIYEGTSLKYGDIIGKIYYDQLKDPEHTLKLLSLVSNYDISPRFLYHLYSYHMDHLCIFMERYDSYLVDFFGKPCTKPRSEIDQIADKVFILIKRLIDLGMFCRDLKLENVVYRRISTEQIDIRLIDFSDLCSVDLLELTAKKDLKDAKTLCLVASLLIIDGLAMLSGTRIP